MMNEKIIFRLLFLGLVFLNCSGEKKNQSGNILNVLDITGIPKSAKDISCYCFSDQGCWIGFGLPERKDTACWGGYTGPFLMHEGKWSAPGLLRLTIERDENPGVNILSETDEVAINFIPGRLSQRFQSKSYKISSDLIFISGRTAAVRIGLKNSGIRPLTLNFSLKGEVFPNYSLFGDTHRVFFNNSRDSSVITLQVPESYNVSVNCLKMSYGMTFTKPIIIEPGENHFKYMFFTITFNALEKREEQTLIDTFISNPYRFFKENKKRWNTYMKPTITPLRRMEKSYKKIAVKSLLTLITNWRSKAGDLHYDGLFPSYVPGYFNGFWAWDSWKHAAVLASYAPELAKDQIRTMFAYQNKEGMIPDVIYKNKKENNRRNSKPPLAAWAVWQVYKKTGDFSFVEEMLPRLIAYHNWWYTFRDHDGNGLCEYGSADGSLTAAKWESGMDDGVRFDKSDLIKNSDGAWSLTQESVDLNSYLYAEKLIIASFMELSGYQFDAEIWYERAHNLGEKIRTHMFDVNNGYFYDIDLTDKSFIQVQGSEGWIPLWAGAATQEQAERVMQVMTDSSKFATYIPLPTVSADNSEFMSGYWRGPVWIDQVYFGIKGLELYGFTDQAYRLRKEMINRLQGLKDSTFPIYENYDPRNGKALNAAHFSWSAAHLLLLLWGK